MVTGKNKEKFEEWYLMNYALPASLCTVFELMNAPFDFQVGVYLAYYDSLGYQISIKYFWDDDGDFKWWFPNHKNDGYGQTYTRQEAYKEAFKKANKIVNNL